MAAEASTSEGGYRPFSKSVTEREAPGGCRCWNCRFERPRFLALAEMFIAMAMLYGGSRAEAMKRLEEEFGIRLER